VRSIQHVLYPIRKFSASFGDDISVYSNEFDHHLADLEKFLRVVKESGFTLNLKKCKFPQSHVSMSVISLVAVNVNPTQAESLQ